MTQKRFLSFLEFRNKIGSWSAARAVVAATLVGYWVTYVCNLGFARDDWNHYVNMRDLHMNSSVIEAVWSIATNDWFGAHELRVFFGSFLTHYVVSVVGGLSSLAIYAIQGGMHVASAAIAGWIMWKLLRSRQAGVVTALLLTFAPTIAQPAMWINNLFFVQPWFLLCLVVALLMAKKRSFLWTIITAVLAVACQFSGEATIPLLYGVLALFAVLDLRVATSWGARLRAVTPIVVSAVSMTVYLIGVATRPEGTQLQIPTWEALVSYAQGVREQFLAMSDVTSGQYGLESVGSSLATVLIALALCLLAVAGILWAPAGMLASRTQQWRVLAVLFCCLLLTLVPLFLGMVTGARPGPDLRYLYVPSLIFYLLIVVIVLMVAQSLGSRSMRVIKALFCVLIVYSICATTFNIVDIWGQQRRIDNGIWAKADALLDGSTQAIVTFNPNHQYLMAPYLSNAVSDFQADWGVAGRVSWLHPEWERLEVFRDAHLDPSGAIAFRGYYGDSTSCFTIPTNGPAIEDQVIYMTYDYGRTFADLDSAPLLVTKDLAEYERSRNDILNRHPDATRWSAASIEGACATP